MTQKNAINSLQDALNSSAQLVFDTVSVRLLKQGKSAFADGNCVYQHPREKNLRCAVGLLLSDDELNEALLFGANGASVSSLVRTFDYKYQSDGFSMVEFLARLQGIHDRARVLNNFPLSWHETVSIGLRDLAEQSCLVTDVLDQEVPA